MQALLTLAEDRGLAPAQPPGASSTSRHSQVKLGGLKQPSPGTLKLGSLENQFPWASQRLPWGWPSKTSSLHHQSPRNSNSSLGICGQFCLFGGEMVQKVICV